MTHIHIQEKDKGHGKEEVEAGEKERKQAVEHEDETGEEKHWMKKVEPGRGGKEKQNSAMVKKKKGETEEWSKD